MADASKKALCCQLKICNKRGLHARASAKFVQLAEKFHSKISVQKSDMSIDACSLMGLMMLGASCGSFLTVCAEGEDAKEALEALRALVQNGFGEKE